jgi:tRNA threonylcarbamoyl adenosine modification protein YeaZ
LELAIDTSSNAAGLALSHEGRLLADLSWQSVHNHTVEVMPNILHLLEQADAGPATLDTVVVAKGPGSFNGLRVGMSVAKGLAFALGIRLLGISTLEAEAYPFAHTGLPLRPLHKAGREEIATALYQRVDNQWLRLESEHLTTLDALCRQTEQETLFCGEALPEMISQIKRDLGRLARTADSPGPSRVVSLAMLGWERLSRQEEDEPAALQPLYLRPPHITKASDRRS